eukprot:3072795-Prymnesium_polylepis.2
MTRTCGSMPTVAARSTREGRGGSTSPCLGYQGGPRSSGDKADGIDASAALRSRACRVQGWVC